MTNDLRINIFCERKREFICKILNTEIVIIISRMGKHMRGSFPTNNILRSNNFLFYLGELKEL